MDGIMDAVECFHRMASEWTMEVLTQDETEWVCGKQSDIVLGVFVKIFL